MGLNEKIERQLLKVFPIWIIIPVFLILVGIEIIANIQGTKDFFEKSNMDWIYTLIDKIAWLAQWLYPLLTIYLILVIAALRKLVLLLNTNISKLETRLNTDVNRLDNYVDTRINITINHQSKRDEIIHSRIDTLTEFTKAEIDRVDKFKKTLIPFHIRHQSEILYQHSMLYRLINSSDLTLPAETRKENTLKALRDIFMAISTASSTPVNYMDLKIYLNSAKSILSETTKEYVEESEATYTWQINLVITFLEKVDTNKALVPEIGEIKKILFKLNKPFEYID
jgi:hypothetical protein